MSDTGSLAGFSEAAARDDASLDAAGFSAGPRRLRAAATPHAELTRPVFRARPRDALTGAAIQASNQLDFAIRPPPDARVEPNVPASSSVELPLASPPSSNESAHFDTALLRERIEARHELQSAPNSGSESGGSAAITGMTRWIDQPSDASTASRSRARPRADQRQAASRGRSKRQRLTGVLEAADEDGQSAVSGMFGRAPMLEPPSALFGGDDGDNSSRNGSIGNNQFAENGSDFRDAQIDAGRYDAAPSMIRSDHAESDLFVGQQNTSNESEAAAEDDNDESPERNSLITSDFVRPRPRDPAEPEPPIVFEVPVSMIPEIDWLSVALDAEGQVLQQRLEHSESESDSDESLGSVAEMIASESDTEAENDDGNAEWKPKEDPLPDDAASSASDSDDSYADSFTVATVSESEDSEFTPDVAEQVVELGSRNSRPKRHRIPTVKWWLGERIQYETEGPLQTLTAVDVRRVEPEKKVYRRRRPYRRRRGPMLPTDEDEAEAGQQAIHAPVLDAAGGRFRERTVARSINGLEFEPVYYADGSVMPLVSRCAIFGGTSSAPVQLYVLRIQPGAVYTYEADANKVCTFVVWRGRCTAKMNRTDFDLQKGMACIVPPANDLYVDNDSTTEKGRQGLGEDVFFFATEINARDSPDLAAAMTRDAQSVVSGAATLSRLFQLDRNDDLNQNAESFVSGLHQYSQRDASQHDERSPPADSVDDDGGLLGLVDDFNAGGNDMPEPSPPSSPGYDADDAVSVAPSIFRDLQDFAEGKQQEKRRNEFLSFQLGRLERARAAAPERGPELQEDGPPSFHLERGARLVSDVKPLSQPLDFRAGSQPNNNNIRHHQPTPRAPPREVLLGPTSQSQRPRFTLDADNDEIDNFFAQVNEELEHEDPTRGPIEESTASRPSQVHQYMLDRLTRVGRRPNDTDTQSSF